MRVASLLVLIAACAVDRSGLGEQEVLDGGGRDVDIPDAPSDAPTAPDAPVCEDASLDCVGGIELICAAGVWSERRICSEGCDAVPSNGCRIPPEGPLLRFDDGEFSRSTATFVVRGGSLVLVPADLLAREDVSGSTEPLASFERAWSQLVEAPRDALDASWARAGSMPVASRVAEPAPDGTLGVLRCTLPATGAASAYCPFWDGVGGIGEPYTASMWVRAASPTAFQGTFNRTTSAGERWFVESLSTSWTRMSLTDSSPNTSLFLVVGEGRAVSGLGTVVTGMDVLSDLYNVHAGRYPLRSTPSSGPQGADILEFAAGSWDERLGSGRWTTTVFPRWASDELAPGEARWLVSFAAGDGVRLVGTGSQVRAEVSLGGVVVASSSALRSARLEPLLVRARLDEGRIELGSAGAEIVHDRPIRFPDGRLRWGGQIGGALELDGQTTEPVAD